MATAAAMQGTNNQPMEFYHCRLRHLSSKALEMLTLSDFSSSIFYSKMCDVCICATETRDSFHLSINKTSCVFRRFIAIFRVRIEQQQFADLDIS